MRVMLCWCCLLIVLLAGTALALEAPPEAGQPADSLQLVLGAPPEAWYVLGDAISVPLLVKNTGTHDLTFSHDRCCSFYDHVFLVAADGTPCPASQARDRLRHAGPQNITIKAGESVRLDQSLTGWVEIPKPGVYTLWFVLAVPAQQRTAPAAAQAWQGTAVSNAVTVTILSPEEYATRTGTGPAPGPLAGLTLRLRPEAAAVHLGAPLIFTATLTNTGPRPLTVPWTSYARLARRSPVGGLTYVTNTYWQNAGRAASTITLQPGETREVSLPAGEEHIRAGLRGPIAYRVDLWVPHLLAAAWPATAGQAAAPDRVASAEATVTIEVAEADLDALLGEVTREITAGNRYYNRTTAYTALCASLDALARWLPARARGEDTPARLARELDTAVRLRPLLAERGWRGVRVAADGTYTFVPETLNALAELPAGTTDAAAFARAFVRLRRSAGIINQALSADIAADPQVKSEKILHLAAAITQQAKVENVYIYRVQMQLPPEVGNGVALPLAAEGSFSQLISITAGEHATAPLVFRVLPYPDPDPRPNYYRGWEHPGLVQALADMPTAPTRLTSLAALTAYLAGRAPRHEQVLLVTGPEVRWQQVCDTLHALHAWHPVPVTWYLGTSAAQ